jgi:protein-L-isoaspartate O-methyltransferase
MIVRDENGVRSLSWPEHPRGLTQGLVRDLAAAIAGAPGRVALLGAGASFCCGLDRSALGSDAEIRAFFLAIEDLLAQIAAADVTAHVRGEARGVGAVIATAARERVVADGAVIDGTTDEVGLPIVAWMQGLSTGAFRRVFTAPFQLDGAVLLAGCSVAMRTPHVVTTAPVVEDMLALAQVGPDDVVYDLGCGTGEIVIAAAQRCKRAVGIDIDERVLALARAAAERAGARVELVLADIFACDISAATVVTLYLLPAINALLHDKLRAELAPGTRIVSNGFGIGPWAPHASRGNALLWIV